MLRLLTPAVATCATALLPAQESAAVEFRAGDVADLRCRVARTLDAGDSSSLLLVEVRNQGDLTAEPATFAIAARGSEPLRVDRLPPPHAHRHGRGVPAGGERDYWLQVATGSDLRRAKVTVTKALFYRGEPLAEAPLRLGGMAHGPLDDQGMRIDATTVGVTNTAKLPLDVVLLGSFTRPRRGRALLTLRLQPGEQRQWQITMMPSELKWWGAGGTYGVRLEKLEPVDWTVLLPEDSAALREAAVAAYRGWLQWRPPYPALTGRFVLRSSRTDRDGGRPREVRGTFRLEDIAPPFADLEGSADLELRSDLDKALSAAFADLRRPPADEFARQHRFSAWDSGDPRKIKAEGPGWPDRHGEILWLRDGRIVGLEQEQARGQYWEEWQLQPEPGGYLVVGRRRPHRLNKNLEIERYSYGRVGDLLVPLAYSREVRYGDYRHLVQLSLADLAPATSAAGPPPVQGAAVEELRAAWQRAYRYPEETVTLTARFELRNPGNDDLWEGQRVVKGTLRLLDFRGFRQDNRGWSGYEIEVAGRGMTRDLQAHLAFAVEDRLRMWAYRDFAGRQPFEKAFAGARIDPDPEKPGLLRVTNGPVASVRLQDGRIAELIYEDGRVRRFRWQEVAGAEVAPSITTGDEELTATIRRVREGLLVPVKMRFAGVFPDWGPETLVLDGVKVQ